MNLAIGLRNLGRVREIVSVLVTYGFGYVFDQLGLDRALPVGRRRAVAREYAEVPGPARLRLALGELGPTFIKLGQILSARGDLLPSGVVAELRRLQDEAPEVPFDQIRGVLETELGRPVEQCFRELDARPLSAASLGQVHAATLRDGREVTVKVLRPGVRGVVEGDIQILSDAAYLLQRQVPQLARYDLPGFVRRFASQIEDELVYTVEAYNAERLGRTLTDAGCRIRVPAVIWDLTTRRVLTSERLRGRRVDRLSGAEVGFDRVATARELGGCVLHQIFVDGFFHGDPHQGNVLFGDDGTIMLLDFGIMGYLDPRTRRLLGSAMRCINEEDVDGLVETMAQLGTLAPDTDLGSLRSELTQIVSRLLTLPPGELTIGELLARSLRAMWAHHIRVPPEVSLAAKALLMSEAICSELDPRFDLRKEAEPVVEEIRQRLLSPSALVERALRAGEAAARHLGRLPARVDRVLSLVEHGGLRVRMEDPEAHRCWHALGRGLNRLALSMLSAGLLVAGAVLLAGAEHAAVVGVGVAAVGGAVVLGLVVLLALLRPGRL